MSSAYYVLSKAMGVRFLNVDRNTGALYWTSSPHGATLFTSKAMAEETVKSGLGHLIEYKVCPTRVWEPNVIRGNQIQRIT
jgi:hypothetical protein